MKESAYKNYAELPLFLNSKTVAKVLGVSPSSGYELMHEPGFPVAAHEIQQVQRARKFFLSAQRSVSPGSKCRRVICVQFSETV